jgi:hypothetical protein
LADPGPTPCPACGAPAATGAGECSACGVIFAKWSEKLLREKARAILEAQQLSAPENADAAAAAAPLTPRQAVAIPAAVFLAAALLAWSDSARFFVQAGLSMQVHELGHALVSWLGGRFAVPLPMVTMSFSPERSILFALAVTAALAWLAKTAWEEDCRALLALCAVLLLLQFRLSVLARMDVLDFWVAFGGLGGECAVASLLVVFYFHPLPRAARWPAYRAVFLFIGACVLASSLRRWRDADADFMNVPWGSFWGGDGDVEAMISGGWTVNVLVKVYLRLVWICAGGAALAWGRAVWNVRGRWSRAAELLE